MWKTTISFVMPVRPSARNNSAPTGWIFIKSDINIFRKSVDKVQVSFKSEEYRVIYIKTNIQFWSDLAEFFLEWERFSRKL
jgi:hypothetical protein